MRNLPTGPRTRRASHTPRAAILSTTRAVVLRLLSGKHTTGDIARRVGISAASASEHAASLRAAGLTVSRRDGKAVVHQASVLVSRV